MPTLHGFSYSNYYNMPKHVLLYKGVAFEEDLVYPSAKDYGQLSPALKVPSLTTNEGQHLSEASVLCEYIEEAYPDKPLLPTTPTHVGVFMEGEIVGLVAIEHFPHFATQHH